jgi:hypothetical protein
MPLTGKSVLLATLQGCFGIAVNNFTCLVNTHACGGFGVAFESNYA